MNGLGSAISNIVRGSYGAIRLEEGDYQSDGLWYCGKCRTPKQTRVTILGRTMTPMCLCKCAAEEWEKAEKLLEAKKKEQTLKEYRRLGFPDAEMSGATFVNDDGGNPELTRLALHYAEGWTKNFEEGRGLLLYGKTGTGKSFAAGCIANAIIEKGFPVLMTNFARLANSIQAAYNRQDEIDALNRFSLLIIDDLAAERNTSYMSEIVQSIIDARCRTRLPLIVTTNLTGEDMKRPEDVRQERLYSRLFEMCFPYEVKGKDRRRESLRASYEDQKREYLGEEGKNEYHNSRNRDADK